MLGGRKSQASVGVVVLGVMSLFVLLAMATSSLAAPCPNGNFRSGVSATLPDCRAFERVSPAEKSGISAYPLPSQSAPVQVSSSGEKLGYVTFSAFPGAVGNTAVGGAGHVSARSAEGWQTAEWTPALPAEALKRYEVDFDFSEDLSQAVLQVPSILLTPEATPNVENLYLRHPDGAYTLIDAGHPAITPEAVCGLSLLWVCFQFLDKSTYAGSSSDMRHMLFESTAQLMSTGPPTGTEALYENFNGHLRLVGVLPDGSPASSATAGSGSGVQYRNGAPASERRVEHAIARDGSRVVFEAPSDEGGPDAEQSGLIEVYDRLEGSETIELSAPGTGATPKVTTPETATFWDASEDGLHVFFTSAAELTTESNTGSTNNGEDLYEYNLQSKTLTDLTVDMNIVDESSGAMVQGVAGVSGDGSYVYFVANGVLVEGKGVDGEPNLYVVHNGGSPRFIATLSAADASDWTQSNSELQSYVTPDGKHLEFASRTNPPSVNFPEGYDNHDQKTGEPDSELYEYNAAETEEPSHLVCASCDPSGARPVGDAFTSGSSGFSKGRVVSDNGSRVFYTARTLPAPEIEKVFEYEQEGEGDCVNPLGCQSLLSDAGGAEEEQFLGAGANGDDVFVSTSSQLAPGDTDNLRDVYDVRVDGGIASPPTESICESECRVSGAATTMSPAIVGVTAGPSGNMIAPVSVRKVTPARKCAKGRKRRHGKCVKVNMGSRKAKAHKSGGAR